MKTKHVVPCEVSSLLLLSHLNLVVDCISVTLISAEKILIILVQIFQNYSEPHVGHGQLKSHGTSIPNRRKRWSELGLGLDGLIQIFGWQ